MSMTSTDPMADMLTRIRNAIAVRKAEISLPHSIIKEAVARLLHEGRFIAGVRVVSDAKIKTLVLTLNDENSNAQITEIVRLSKPGRRYYVSAREIPVIKRGRGIVILSTNKGIMSGERAKHECVGGELICKVY